MNKTIIGIGDSLMYGNLLGNEVTWLNKIGKKHQMNYYNYGENGASIAKTAAKEWGCILENCFQITEDISQADCIIVLGGANDKRLNVPIGENADIQNNTFKGALNLMIDHLRERYPHARLLFMTNYHRYTDVNGLGYGDVDYVDAMLEICRLKGIPCFDNYRDSGIDFQDKEQAVWVDEGIYLGGSSNRHLSPKAYDYLMPIYESFIFGDDFCQAT